MSERLKVAPYSGMFMHYADQWAKRLFGLPERTMARDWVLGYEGAFWHNTEGLTMYCWITQTADPTVNFTVLEEDYDPPNDNESISPDYSCPLVATQEELRACEFWMEVTAGEGFRR